MHKSCHIYIYIIQLVDGDSDDDGDEWRQQQQQQHRQQRHSKVFVDNSIRRMSTCIAATFQLHLVYNLFMDYLLPENGAYRCTSPATECIKCIMNPFKLCLLHKRLQTEHFLMLLGVFHENINFRRCRRDWFRGRSTSEISKLTTTTANGELQLAQHNLYRLPLQ